MSRTSTPWLALLMTPLLALAADWAVPGPDVGQPFGNALATPDEAGKVRSLDSVMGERGAVVFFVRSADWCPFCKRQLVDVNGRRADFAKLGLELVSVSVDPVDKVAAFHSAQDIGYTMLADEKGALVDALGIRDAQYPTGSKAYGVPHPIIYVIDRKGIVRARFAEEGYRTRPDLDAVLASVKALEM